MACILYIPANIKYRIFQQTNFFRFANVINIITIINHFNSDNNNNANLKTLYCQIITTIAKGILKFNPMMKKSTVTNHTFFALVTFSRTNYFAYINSIVILPSQNLFIRIKKQIFISLKKIFQTFNPSIFGENIYYTQ